MNSAATQFEAQLQAARALTAATGNGAIVVQPRIHSGLATAPGFKSIVYAGRPTGVGALLIRNVPPISADADLTEASLGPAPFAIFFSGSGQVSMAGSYPPRAEFDSPAVAPIASEPACPAAGRYTLAFLANGSSRTLVLPCPITLGGTPLPIVTNTPPPITR